MDSSTTCLHLEDFSNEGLRTLVLAEKVVSQEFYEQWRTKYDAANMLMFGKDDAVDKISEEIEFDFDLVGSTAIEDKLQD